jgi:YHS domain-containing protein
MSRFLFFLFLIAFFTYRLGRFVRRVSSHRPMRGAGRTDPRTGSEDELVQDPNCLTYLSKREALESRKEGVVFYFCSPACVSAFTKK